MIRPFGYRDIFLVSRLSKKGTPLEMERGLLGSSPPLARALAHYLSFDRWGASTFVCHLPPRGFIQGRDGKDGTTCHLDYIAPSLEESPQAQEVWLLLLGGLSLGKGEGGVQRLLAKIAEEDSKTVDTFRQAGFRPYARRQIFRLERWPQEPPTASSLLRPRRASDHGRLERLNDKMTPRPVQGAEGLERWTCPRYHLWGREWKEYVAERGEEIVAYFQAIPGERGHLLKAAIQSEEGQELLGQALALFAPYPPLPIYCEAREYEPELKGALLNLGFSPLRDELLMVKYTAIPVEVPLVQPQGGLEKKVGGVPTASACQERAKTPLSEAR